MPPQLDVIFELANGIRSDNAILILRKVLGLAAPEVIPIAPTNQKVTIMLPEIHGTVDERVRRYERVYIVIWIFNQI